MNDYISALESELLRAAGERLPADRRRRRLRTLRTGLAVAASAAVVVAVLVIAVGGHDRGHPARRAATQAHRPSAARTLAELRARLAVLRRPQTAADRRINTAVVQRRSALPVSQIIPGETRLVTQVPGGRAGRLDVYVVVQVPGRNWPPSPLASRGPQAAVEISRVSGRAGGSWMFGGTVAALENPRTIAEFYDYALALLPDGVARVRWTFLPDPLKPHRHVTPPTRTVTVHDNVAIVRVPAVAQHYVPLGLVRATWYAADGRVIKRYR